jgi:hypothetical protein
MIIEHQSKLVLSALESLTGTYAAGKELKSIYNECKAVFLSEDDFSIKLSKLDSFIAKAGYEEIEELIFDLALVHFLSAIEHDEEYFDTDEWMDIEEKTVNRGTELLNVFLYINEATDTDAEISLEDFLNEFLLTDMDEFQDEFKIYEPLIENDLEEAEVDELIKLKNSLKDDSDIKDFIVPMVMFFQTPTDLRMLEQYKSKINLFEQSVLASLLAFNNQI